MKKMAKLILADEGIKVFQKDIKRVEIKNVTVIDHDGDRVPHRQIVMVEMNNGTRYDILRETVDSDGNFSTMSAKMVTREVRVNGE